MAASLAPLIVPPGEGSAMSGLGDTYVRKLSADATGDRFSLGEYCLDPGSGPPLHRHMCEDEAFWVLEGEMSFWVEGTVHKVLAGGCAFAPRGCKHTFKNCSDRPARLLVLVSPGKNFEDFYAAFLRIINASLAPDATMAQVIALGERHGIEFFGPNPM